MPNAKRQKASGSAKAKQKPEPPPKTDESRPTPAEVEEEEHPFVLLSRKHWLKPSKKGAKTKVKNDVVKQGIWDVIERESFQYKSLVLLENSQALEK